MFWIYSLTIAVILYEVDESHIYNHIFTTKLLVEIKTDLISNIFFLSVTTQLSTKQIYLAELTTNLPYKTTNYEDSIHPCPEN